MDYVISIIGPLAEGSLVTLKLFFITLALALPLGLALALVRISRFRSLALAVGGYLWLMRGTPLMLQLLFIYFALPFVPVVGVRLPDFPAAVVAFALNYAAYFAEIFRAGIQSIDRGQYEGAKVLGFSYGQTMRRIVLPQVVKRILPPMSNETITLVKDTSLIYVLALNDLLRANDLTTAVPIFAGQRLWIPGETAPGSLIDLPLPFTSVALKPTPAVQGQTIGIHITTDGPATLSGDFMGYPIQTVTHDANQHDALFGIHPFTEPGIYPLNLIVTSPDGAQSALALRVRVDSGGYGSETISLDAAQANLLQNDVTEPEWQRIATVMSGFTAQRFFDGLMGLPSTGAITSQFGTRRDYNGGSLNTFHSGTDFGGGPGSPVLAPAAGVVVLTETMPVRGNATVIDHGWGVFTGYWHQTEILVAVGDVVQAGQKIGTPALYDS